MKSCFTLNDLILFAYSDTLEKEDDHSYRNENAKVAIRKEIHRILEWDANGLSGSRTPDRDSLRHILSYSRSVQVFMTKTVETVYKVMN